MIKNKKGFTLIELLVVIAIIGLLSTLAVVALNNAREKARDAKRVADIKQMQTAFELFATENNGAYPNTVTSGVSDAVALALGSNSIVLDCADGSSNAAVCDKISDGGIGNVFDGNTYMGLIPGDPSGPEIECLQDAGTTPCIYSYRTNGTSLTDYCISFSLEGTVGSLVSGPNTGTPFGIISGACPI